MGRRSETTRSALCILSFYVTPTGSRFRRLRGGKTRDGLGSGISSEKEEVSLSVLFTARLRTVPLRDDDSCLWCCRRRRLDAVTNGRSSAPRTGGAVQGVLVPSSSSSFDARVGGSSPSSSVASDVAVSWWPLRQQAAAFGHVPQRVRRCLGQVCTLRPSPGLW